LFCTAIEHDVNLKQIRDMSFIEELLKTKSIMRMMKDKVEKQDSEVDIVEYALATRTLETKLKVLHSLNIHVEGEDANKITLNVNGSSKAIEIDLVKLRESITILDKQVTEKQASPADIKPLVENIDIEGLTEEEFLAKAVEKIGPV
jgi:ABC-type thiamine transport system substrate-binding protein